MGPTGVSIEQWSSTVQLPSTLLANSFVAALPLGVNPPQDVAQGGLLTNAAVTVPQSCTAANFQVTMINAEGSSSAQVSLAKSSPSPLVQNYADPIGVSCTIIANGGLPVSCSSPADVLLYNGDFLTIVVNGFTSPADYQNTDVYVSFTCQ